MDDRCASGPDGPEARLDSAGAARSNRRGGAARARWHGAVRYRRLELPKRCEGGGWCSGVSLIETAGAGDVRRGRRVDLPLLDDDLLFDGRVLREARELEGDAGGAVGGVVCVVLVSAAALHMGGRTPRRARFGSRCQERRYALGREREAGGQNEDTRPWAAEAAEHAVHYRKLARCDSTVTTRNRGTTGSPVTTWNGGRGARRGYARAARSVSWKRGELGWHSSEYMCSHTFWLVLGVYGDDDPSYRTSAPGCVRECFDRYPGVPTLAPRGDHGRYRHSHPPRGR